MSKKTSPLEGARKPSPTSKDTTSKATTNKDVDNLVTELRPHDVIMGRGLSASEYEGNKRLRKMVQSRREAYVNAESREAKQNVAREIIAAVRAQGGRFLRRHVAFGASSTQSVWQAIQDPEEMMTKVKQLLRDMAPEVKERRVQRRRRQAEWARQHAYTNLFPDLPNCPFGGVGTNRNNENSKSVKPPASASASTATTRSEPVLSAGQGVPPSLTASLNSHPHDILPPISSSLPVATTTTSTSSVTNSLTGTWERAAAIHNASRVSLPPSSTVSFLMLQDVQRLLVSQQQEQEQQRLRLIESLSASAQALTTSSVLPISSNTTMTIDPRLVLLELQRHAGSAPRMALSESASTAQERAPAARTLDQAFQELDRSSSSSSMNTNTEFRHLSEEDLARLVLLERWNSLRR